MKIEIDEYKKVDGKWAKVGTDIKDGDRLQIKDAGTVSPSGFKNTDGSVKEQYVFKLMTGKKEEFNVALNRTSRNTLGRGFGSETEAWIGKVVTCFVVKQMIDSSLKNVLYLAPDGWIMSEDGEFLNPEEDTESTRSTAKPKVATKETGEYDYPEDTVGVDDMPF